MDEARRVHGLAHGGGDELLGVRFKAEVGLAEAECAGGRGGYKPQRTTIIPSPPESPPKLAVFPRARLSVPKKFYLELSIICD